MQTPILYVDSSIDPFAHLPEELKDTRSKIFFATTRKPARSGTHPPYSNRTSDTMHMGTATVKMGDQEVDWQSLRSSSLSAHRSKPILISLAGVEETAVVARTTPETNPVHPPPADFFSRLNGELAKAADK